MIYQKNYTKSFSKLPSFESHSPKSAESIEGLASSTAMVSADTDVTKAGFLLLGQSVAIVISEA